MRNYGPFSDGTIIGEGTKVSTGNRSLFTFNSKYDCYAVLYKGSGGASYSGVTVLMKSLGTGTNGSSTVLDSEGHIYGSVTSGAPPVYGYLQDMPISNSFGYGAYDWANFNWYFDIFETRGEAVTFLENYSPSSPKYPITYSATNGTVTGPEEAEVGETVVATGTPNANYGITDYTTQISVTCNDIPVPFTYNATTNEITFEMPDPTSG